MPEWLTRLLSSPLLTLLDLASKVWWLFGLFVGALAWV